MKSYLPIIASLFLVSASFISPVNALKSSNSPQTWGARGATTSKQPTEMIAQNIDPHIKNNIAREITVKITSQENGGSGVIIAQQNNTYLVLTNNHVLREDKNFTVQTHDGATYQAKPLANAIESNDDLALLEFNSDKSYQTATINSAATPKVEQSILAVGFAAETGELVTQEGKIQLVPDKTFKDGYQVGYSSNILQGMSGGAILNTDGEVIGINGKSAFPIINTGYVYQDGSQPTPAEIEQYRQLSWGLSLNSFLAQLNPEIITAYNLPLPETVDEVDTQLTGWLGELEAKAKQITVRIDRSDGDNGSGLIIAKEGNSYTVLTADHVICKKDAETRECGDETYEILAPDGQKYPVEASTIKRQEGVDLAVVRFTSNENYQVAQLANYPVTENDAVFVAGHPKLDTNKPAPWLFSLGYGLEREQGLLEINDNSLSTDSSDLTKSQGSLSGGYEMVYTNITYDGMSGGAVLDKEGRVIGIHGSAQGETAFDSQDSSETKIQLGYSLGIPINTFINLTDRSEINALLPVQENRPKELTPEETFDFQIAILGTEIPQGNATAERWLKRGNQLWRLVRYGEAVEAFDRAIALQPEFIHLAYYGKGLALYYEAFYYEDEKEYEAALASLSLATETNPSFAPAFLAKSVVLQKLTRREEALIAIEQAISLQDNNANLYNEKGNILTSLKRYSQAGVAYNQAIDINPRSVFYNNRAILYSDQRKLELALADYNEAITINSNFADAYIGRGNLYQKQEKLELALADYNESIAIDPKYADAYIGRGNLYQKQGKPELALADYNEAIAIDPNPNLAFAYNNRGLLYQKQGKLELALADYNESIAIDPKYADAYIGRGNLYQKQGKLELALADYNEAIAINPKYADAYISRGNLYQKQGKPELALADYNEAIAIDPKYADAYIGRGNLYSDQGKLELALADYNEAIAIDPNPNLALAYNNRGNLYSDQGKLELALADYNEAIAIDPKYADAYINRGFIYSNQGKLELALADYNEAIAIDPNPNLALAYNNRGFIYYEQGKLDLALADYNQAIDLNPNLAQAYFSRGVLYQTQEKLDLSLTDYNKALSLDKNLPPAINNIGLIKYKKGAISEARQHFEQAINIDDSFAETRMALAVTLYSQGQQEQALTMAEKALSIDKQFANPEFLKKNLWGDKLIADTKKLLSHPQIQAFLARL